MGEPTSYETVVFLSEKLIEKESRIKELEGLLRQVAACNTDDHVQVLKDEIHRALAGEGDKSEG